MKPLCQFKSLSRSVNEAAAKTSFASEKLVKEQASVKTDIEMANTKLKESVEHILLPVEELPNALLKESQKEDEKLWKGLESKFSSTKILCDQLTEALHHLAGQVQDAKKNKEFYEGKLPASSEAFDSVEQQTNGLSLKLSSAEGTIRKCEKELADLKNEREEKDMLCKDEQGRTANLIEEKDAGIKKFEATVAASRQATKNLNSELEKVHCELKIIEDAIRSLMAARDNSEKEKNDLELSNADFEKKLEGSLDEIENFVQVSAAQLVELDKRSLTFTEKFDQLNSLYKDAQKIYEKLHDKFLCLTSEKDSLLVVKHELDSTITELQRAHRSVVAQLSEEHRLEGERIRRLE